MPATLTRCGERTGLMDLPAGAAARNRVGLVCSFAAGRRAGVVAVAERRIWAAPNIPRPLCRSAGRRWRRAGIAREVRDLGRARISR
ncbi:hypothetical protein [Myxococcus sp. NMCA1]|uniref:hypothetical protein n=1 Tax=Myxococcus sp. NMCA1 TaxID=2996785 RepID=UPI002285C3EB|nr:hypothetical protein [Myxococcus sp. NMCA1]WAM28753.1 hypothetical protein OZ403_11810 [Myxococcus sp. NMCA1]